MCRAICSERGSIRANSAGGWGRRRRTGNRSRHTRRVTDDIILATPQRCPGSQAADRQPGSSRGRREAVTRLGSEGRAQKRSPAAARTGAPMRGEQKGWSAASRAPARAGGRGERVGTEAAACDSDARAHEVEPTTNLTLAACSLIQSNSLNMFLQGRSPNSPLMTLC